MIDTLYYRFGLIGYPLAHSRSPEMHRAAMAYSGLEGNYQLYPVEDDDQAEMRIANLLSHLREGSLHGLNVTIPHKQRALRLADCLSGVAQGVGAVNTLTRLPDGRILGENTDAGGFLYDIRRHGIRPAGHALVLGAGGSARAVVYGLAHAGWQVLIAARRVEQARELAHSIAGPARQPQALALDSQSLARHLPAIDVLINTTPLGMHPHIDASPWPADLPLPPAALVYDLIYNPLETRLLRSAREQGLPAVNGTGMLAAQGAEAFALWTGMPAPYDVMEHALIQALQA